MSPVSLLAALTLAFACGLHPTLPLLLVALLARAGRVTLPPPFDAVVTAPITGVLLIALTPLDLVQARCGAPGRVWGRLHRSGQWSRGCSSRWPSAPPCCPGVQPPYPRRRRWDSWHSGDWLPQPGTPCAPRDSIHTA